MERCFHCFREIEQGAGFCRYCGTKRVLEPKEPIYLRPGIVLNQRYIIGEAIHQGGFGIVYRAFDMKLQILVAVKEFLYTNIMSRALGSTRVIVSQKATQEYLWRKGRFLAEARCLALFSEHESIVNVFDYFEENHTAYIVMELMEGDDLAHFIRAHGGKVDVDFAIYVIEEVGRALSSFHEKGIIHRDIAPDNIYVCSNAGIKIKTFDVGAAQLIDDDSPVIDKITKIGYTPPEGYEDVSKAGPWMDVYALGATMYELLTGVRPEESTNRVIVDRLKSPKELNPAIPENISNAVMIAMALKKNLRYQRVDDFVKAIKGEKKTTSLKKVIFYRRLRRVISIAAGLILVLGIAIFMYFRHEEKQLIERLRPAEISIWYEAEVGSEERVAMEMLAQDFSSEENFPHITIELKAFSEEEYEQALAEAAESGDLPTLFESTLVESEIIDQAVDLSIERIIQSEQGQLCSFLSQYDEYYHGERKKVPLGFEIPVAYVITSGPLAEDYQRDFFSSLSDFSANANIAKDEAHTELIAQNVGNFRGRGKEEFLNNEENTSAVLISSTMAVNEVWESLTRYSKKAVFYGGEEICAFFTYEWSVGSGSEEEIAAAERLICWMLGERYQDYLMVGIASEGQIPLNETARQTLITEAKDQLMPLERVMNQIRFWGRKP